MFIWTFLVRIIDTTISQNIYYSSWNNLYNVERKSHEYAPAPITNSQWSEHTKRPSKSRFHKRRFTHQSSNDGNEFKAFPSRVQRGARLRRCSTIRERTRMRMRGRLKSPGVSQVRERTRASGSGREKKMRRRRQNRRGSKTERRKIRDIDGTGKWNEGVVAHPLGNVTHLCTAHLTPFPVTVQRSSESSQLYAWRMHMHARKRASRPCESRSQ